MLNLGQLKAEFGTVADKVIFNNKPGYWGKPENKYTICPGHFHPSVIPFQGCKMLSSLNPTCALFAPHPHPPPQGSLPHPVMPATATRKLFTEHVQSTLNN